MRPVTVALLALSLASTAVGENLSPSEHQKAKREGRSEETRWREELSCEAYTEIRDVTFEADSAPGKQMARGSIANDGQRILKDVSVCADTECSAVVPPTIEPGESSAFQVRLPVGGGVEVLRTQCAIPQDAG
jgi:hypothetical protein